MFRITDCRASLDRSEGSRWWNVVPLTTYWTRSPAVILKSLREHPVRYGCGERPIHLAPRLRLACAKPRAEVVLGLRTVPKGISTKIHMNGCVNLPKQIVDRAIGLQSVDNTSC